MANHRRIKTLVILLCFLTIVLLPFLPPVRLTEEKKSSPAYHREIYFAKTSQEFAVHHITGPEKGPTLLVIGGIHGDEKAGYLTAERFVNVRLKNGKLILVPRLNAVAINKNKRQGLGGDMNRLFDLSDKERYRNPDAKVVDVAKQLIKNADYVINLHQAYDFYSYRWVSRQRNPSRWGQSNVIDTPIYQLHNGMIIEPGRFAEEVSKRSNERIRNRNFHFLVNNTNTGGGKSMHKEQRGSLTYYALTKEHKIALAFEATKNCSLPEAVAYLTIAVNASLEQAGITVDPPPAEDFRIIHKEINGQQKDS